MFLSPTEVKLNVYDIGGENDLLRAFGMGLYHTGVEIFGYEWTFSESGVYRHMPRKPPQRPNQPFTYRKTMVVGAAVLIEDDVSDIIKAMKEGDWKRGSYCMLSKNCNHFTEELCKRLVGREIPRWVNRPAKVGGFISDIIGGLAEGLEQQQDPAQLKDSHRIEEVQMLEGPVGKANEVVPVIKSNR